MQVDNILQSKGTTVFTVRADAEVAEAVRVLNAHKVGAVVVVDAAGGVAGILSERDIVRHLGADWAKLAGMPVSACMTAKVITVGRNASVAQLMERMTAHRIRHIPIVEDGKLVGIVSIGDVVKRKIEEAELEAQALKEYIAS